MTRQRWWGVAVAFAFLTGVAGRAAAYGPLTHIGEALRYLEMLHESPLAEPRGDLSILDNDDWRPYLKLGSTFPDVGRALPDRYFEPHDRFFAWHVYEKAIDEYESAPWKLAFAVGYLMHVGGDTGAQVFLTPRTAIRAGWGEMSVVNGFYDDHPGGENEAVVEGWLDIRYGDVSQLFELLDVFVTQGHLDEVLDFYREAGVEFFGPPPTADDPEGDLSAATDFLDMWLSRDLAATATTPSFWLADLAATFNAEPRLATATSPLVNAEELARILQDPAFSDPDFWEEYPTRYKDLGPTYVRQTGPGTGWYDNWSTWEAKVMKAGSLESLAGLRTDVYSAQPDIVVYDVAWTDGDGAPLTQIDVASPPAKVRATVTLFATEDVDTTVTARVRRHWIGVDPASDTVLAQASAAMNVSPFDYATAERTTLTVEWEPSGGFDDTWGLVLDLVTADEPTKPFFTTNFEAFYSLDAIDITQIDAYAMLYGMYDRWPLSVPVTGQSFPSGQAVLRVRAVDVVTGKKIPDAQIVVAGCVLMPANRHGYAESAVPAGDWQATAEGTTYAAGTPVAFSIAAGEDLSITVPADPVPLVSVEGSYTTGADPLAVSWQSGSLAGSPARFEAALGTGTGVDDVTGWTDVGRRFATDLPVENPPEDGTAIYARVRVKNGADVYPAGVSGGVVVDASAPAAPEIHAQPAQVHRNGSDVQLTFSADDPHSGIDGMRYAVSFSDEAPPLDDVDWTNPLDVHVPPVPFGIDTVYVFAQAQNGAGSWSALSTLELPVTGEAWDDDTDDDASDDDTGEADDDETDDDATDDDNEAPGGHGDDDDDSGCGC